MDEEIENEDDQVYANQEQQLEDEYPVREAQEEEKHSDSAE